ncbi:MAG: hypothetical protein PHN19_00455 [Patescibacteria group bacterium]|nr:hypothetical protein [Patescibacteria group bacterium]
MGLIVGIIVVIILIFGVFFVLGAAIGGILGVLGVVALIWITAGFIISNTKEGSISAIVGIIALVLTILFFSTGACKHVYVACNNVPYGVLDSISPFPGKSMVCNGKVVWRSNGKCP